jgi:hypothetical protein
MRELFELGADSLPRFLTRWYGPPDRDSAPSDGDAPPPLRAWFDLTSRWSKPITTQNQVLREPRMTDGKLVFWVENQSAWVWATDPTGADPPVYDRDNVEGGLWQPTGARLSTFLVHVAVFEAVMGAAYGASACWVSPATLAKILAPLRRLPMPEWYWPAGGHWLYAADGLLAFAGPNPEPGETAKTAGMREVWVAGHEPECLAYLKEVEEVDWDAFNA